MQNQDIYPYHYFISYHIYRIKRGRISYLISSCAPELLMAHVALGSDPINGANATNTTEFVFEF